MHDSPDEARPRTPIGPRSEQGPDGSSIRAELKMTTSKQITVLLAEDHATVRQSLCALLNRDGKIKIVGEARTGREAVELAQSLSPDVILMDIAMPVLNGLEATRQIRAINAAAKIII